MKPLSFGRSLFISVNQGRGLLLLTSVCSCDLPGHRVYGGLMWAAGSLVCLGTRGLRRDCMKQHTAEMSCHGVRSWNIYPPLTSHRAKPGKTKVEGRWAV